MPTILITGANRGLGIEFVRQYIAENWRVIATCRNPELAQDLKEIRGEKEIFPMDVSDFKSVEKISALLRSEKIDVLLNNAGIFDSYKKGLGQTNFDEWTNMLRINTLAPLKIIESFQNHYVGY